MNRVSSDDRLEAYFWFAVNTHCDSPELIGRYCLRATSKAYTQGYVRTK